MALENPKIIDAIGIEKDTQFVILTIADVWNWEDEKRHLLGLQAKIDAYLSFIENGEIWEAYPEAIGKQLVINVVGKFPIPQRGLDFLKHVSDECEVSGIKIRNQCYPGSDESSFEH